MTRPSARATRYLLLAAVLVGAIAVAGSVATAGMARSTEVSRGGALTGIWKGTLSGSAGGSIHRERILIVVNARESAGRWKTSPSCHGSLTLESVSGGYHHFRQRAAASASCLGGDVDCLMRIGAKIYDSVTPRPGSYARTGTLHRVRNR